MLNWSLHPNINVICALELKEKDFFFLFTSLNESESINDASLIPRQLIYLVLELHEKEKSMLILSFVRIYIHSRLLMNLSGA